jgi:hypothetical protein
MVLQHNSLARKIWVVCVILKIFTLVILRTLVNDHGWVPGHMGKLVLYTRQQIQFTRGELFLLGWCESIVAVYKDRGGRVGVYSGIYTKNGHGYIVHISQSLLSRKQSFEPFRLWILIVRVSIAGWKR